MKHEELITSTEYFLVKTQNDVYNLVNDYMEREGLSKVELAKQWSMSEDYISQILNGDFNGSLENFMDIAYRTNHVVNITFLSRDEYLTKRRKYLQ